ncbi:transcriptional regulator swi6 [Phlyctochytrium planicorne]|nr:transcriptional regulator swi6 [Phlyctochytrium planicorne]
MAPPMHGQQKQPPYDQSYRVDPSHPATTTSTSPHPSYSHHQHQQRQQPGQPYNTPPTPNITGIDKVAEVGRRPSWQGPAAATGQVSYGTNAFFKRKISDETEASASSPTDNTARDGIKRLKVGSGDVDAIDVDVEDAAPLGTPENPVVIEDDQTSPSASTSTPTSAKEAEGWQPPKVPTRELAARASSNSNSSFLSVTELLGRKETEPVTDGPLSAKGDLDGGGGVKVKMEMTAAVNASDSTAESPSHVYNRVVDVPVVSERRYVDVPSIMDVPSPLLVQRTVNGRRCSQIYTAVHQGLRVYEIMVDDRIPVMRRRDDSFVNSTQILKVAGVAQTKRASVNMDAAEFDSTNVQGVYVSLDKAKDIARLHGIEEILEPLLFDPAVGPAPIKFKVKPQQQPPPQYPIQRPYYPAPPLVPIQRPGPQPPLQTRGNPHLYVPVASGSSSAGGYQSVIARPPDVISPAIPPVSAGPPPPTARVGYGGPPGPGHWNGVGSPTEYKSVVRPVGVSVPPPRPLPPVPSGIPVSLPHRLEDYPVFKREEGRTPPPVVISTHATSNLTAPLTSTPTLAKFPVAGPAVMTPSNKIPVPLGLPPKLPLAPLNPQPLNGTPVMPIQQSPSTSQDEPEISLPVPIEELGIQVGPNSYVPRGVPASKFLVEEVNPDTIVIGRQRRAWVRGGKKGGRPRGSGRRAREMKEEQELIEKDREMNKWLSSKGSASSSASTLTNKHPGSGFLDVLSLAAGMSDESGPADDVKKAAAVLGGIWGGTVDEEGGSAESEDEAEEQALKTPQAPLPTPGSSKKLELAPNARSILLSIYLHSHTNQFPSPIPAILRLPLDPITRDPILHWAIRLNKWDLVESMAKRDPSVTGGGGCTALMRALGLGGMYEEGRRRAGEDCVKDGVKEVMMLMGGWGSVDRHGRGLMHFAVDAWTGDSDLKVKENGKEKEKEKEKGKEKEGGGGGGEKEKVKGKGKKSLAAAAGSSVNGSGSDAGGCGTSNSKGSPPSAFSVETIENKLESVRKRMGMLGDKDRGKLEKVVEAVEAMEKAGLKPRGGGGRKATRAESAVYAAALLECLAESTEDVVISATSLLNGKDCKGVAPFSCAVVASVREVEGDEETARALVSDPVVKLLVEKGVGGAGLSDAACDILSRVLGFVREKEKEKRGDGKGFLSLERLAGKGVGKELGWVDGGGVDFVKAVLKGKEGNGLLRRLLQVGGRVLINAAETDASSGSDEDGQGMDVDDETGTAAAVSKCTLSKHRRASLGFPAYIPVTKDLRVEEQILDKVDKMVGAQVGPKPASEYDEKVVIDEGEVPHLPLPKDVEEFLGAELGKLGNGADIDV